MGGLSFKSSMKERLRHLFRQETRKQAQAKTYVQETPLREKNGAQLFF